MHFLAIPNNLIDDIKSEGKNGMSSPSTMRCLGIAGSGDGDGRWFVMVAKAKLKQAQTTFGGWVHVDFEVDDSSMACPSPRFTKHVRRRPSSWRFDALLPGKRRNVASDRLRQNRRHHRQTHPQVDERTRTDVGSLAPLRLHVSVWPTTSCRRAT